MKLESLPYGMINMTEFCHLDIHVQNKESDDNDTGQMYLHIFVSSNMKGLCFCSVLQWHLGKEVLNTKCSPLCFHLPDHALHSCDHWPRIENFHNQAKLVSVIANSSYQQKKKKKKRGGGGELIDPLSNFCFWVQKWQNPNSLCLVGGSGWGQGRGVCWTTFQLLFLSSKMTKSQIPHVRGGGGGGLLLKQPLGGHVGFAIHRPTEVNHSMVPLADTSASGDHKKCFR